jgi:RHS repeat-associated protein
LTFSQTLNARQRPETLQLKNGAGSTLQSLTYSYSAAGDVTWILDGVDGADTVNNLTYDGLHRLKTANGIWGSYSYTYDGLNNLISRTGTNPLNYGYDTATNRLSGVSGAVSRNYGYNPRGGMIGDGTKSFTLNANDQITNITGIASYGYDGSGKRIKTTQADGSIEYAIYDQSGALVSHALVTAGQNNDYVQLDGRTIAEVLNGVPTYLHPDLLGSPRLGTDANGAIQWQEHFDPYGSKLNGTSEKIGYTGHAYDADTQLTYAQARFYDPAVGRFMSMDPIGFTGNPFTFNRYAYVNNNPYGGTDPSGMEAITGSRIETAENNSSPVRYAEGGTGTGTGTGTGGGKAERMAAVMTGSGAGTSGGSGGGGGPCLGGCHGTTPDGPRREMTPGEARVLDILSMILITATTAGLGDVAVAGEIVEEAAVAAKSAGALGREGEAAVRAAYNIGEKITIQVAGRTRIPDGLTSTVLSEVKNVQSLSYTQQLRDFASYASQNGLRYDLYVRPTTKLSGPLAQEVANGAINLRFIP